MIEHSVCDIRWFTELALSGRLQSEIPYWFRLRVGYVWVGSSVQTGFNGRNMDWMVCAGERLGLGEESRDGDG